MKPLSSPFHIFDRGGTANRSTFPTTGGSHLTLLSDPRFIEGKEGTEVLESGGQGFTTVDTWSRNECSVQGRDSGLVHTDLYRFPSLSTSCVLITHEPTNHLSSDWVASTLVKLEPNDLLQRRVSVHSTSPPQTPLLASFRPNGVSHTPQRTQSETEEVDV